MMVLMIVMMKLMIKMKLMMMMITIILLMMMAANISRALTLGQHQLRALQALSVSFKLHKTLSGWSCYYLSFTKKFSEMNYTDCIPLCKLSAFWFCLSVTTKKWDLALIFAISRKLAGQTMPNLVGGRAQQLSTWITIS